MLFSINGLHMASIMSLRLAKILTGARVASIYSLPRFSAALDLELYPWYTQSLNLKTFHLEGCCDGIT